MLFTENKQELINSLFPFVANLNGDLQTVVTLMALIIIGLFEFGIIAVLMGMLYIACEDVEQRRVKNYLRRR